MTFRKNEFSTIFYSSLGGALEFYDFIIFIYLSTAISHVFFPAAQPEFLRYLYTITIFSIGYLARPIGGVILAHYGDLYGRKNIFILSMTSMAIPTFLIGITPSYDSIGIFAPILLMTFRVLQGLAIGSEVPGAWVFVAEHSQNNHVGRNCSLLTASLTLGILLGALSVVCLNYFFTSSDILEGIWRIPFIFGGILAVIATLMRRKLSESPVFLKMKSENKLHKGMPILNILRHYPYEVVFCMLVTWVLASSLVVAILMTPGYLQSNLKLTLINAVSANSISVLALCMGSVFFGWLGDKIGPGKTLATGSALMGVSGCIFYGSLMNYSFLLYFHYALFGFFVGVIGVAPLILTGMFTPPTRYTGVSFSYNTAHALAGGLSPIIVGLWMHSTKNAFIYFIALQAIIGVLIGLYMIKHKSEKSTI